MRTYLTIRNDLATVPGWPSGGVRYFLRNDGSACAQDDSAFWTLVTALSSSLNRLQKLTAIMAFTLAEVPAAQPGYRWVARDCGGVEVGETTLDFDPDYPLPTDGGGGTDPGSGNDQAAVDVQFFTSLTNNDGGTVSN